jgi:hypothetical protein
MDIWSVPTFPIERELPFVLRIIPGLRARKRAAGMATFWDVMSAIILLCVNIFLPDAQDILTKTNEISKRGTPHHLFVKSVVIHDSPDVLPDVQEPPLKPNSLSLVFKTHPGVNGVMLRVTKSRKIIQGPIVRNMCVIKQSTHRVPHHAKNVIVLQFPIFE